MPELTGNKKIFYEKVISAVPLHLHSQLSEKISKLPDKVEIFVSITQPQDILAFTEMFEAYCYGVGSAPRFEHLNSFCQGLIMLGVSSLLDRIATATVRGNKQEQAPDPMPEPEKGPVM